MKSQQAKGSRGKPGNPHLISLIVTLIQSVNYLRNCMNNVSKVPEASSGSLISSTPPGSIARHQPYRRESHRKPRAICGDGRVQSNRWLFDALLIPAGQHGGAGRSVCAKGRGFPGREYQWRCISTRGGGRGAR